MLRIYKMLRPADYSESGGDLWVTCADKSEPLTNVADFHIGMPLHKSHDLP
jgi:hypothetical protein